MADLTKSSLLFVPHTSASRLPTGEGLRLSADGLLTFGELAENKRLSISAALPTSGRSQEETLAEASLSYPVPSAADALMLCAYVLARGEPHQIGRAHV